MAKGFTDAVKEMHQKMENIKAPVSAPGKQGGSPTETINLIKKFPQLLYPKTGK